MRFASLLFKFLAILAIYAFACGALIQQGTGGGYWHHFLSRLLAPLNGLNPVSGSVLVGGAFLFSAGVVLAPRRGETKTLWVSLVSAAFAVNALGICASLAFIFAGSRFSGRPSEVGALFAAGVTEVGLGMVLGTLLFLLRRPRLADLPAVCLFLIGVGSLGAMFWIGKGAIS